MPVRNSTEEKQLINLIPRLSIPGEDKTTWIENIQTNGLSEAIAEEIREKLSNSPEDESDAMRVKRTTHLMTLTRIVRQWRMSRQSRHFTKHRS